MTGPHARLVATAAAGLSAFLYLLIGLEVLSIGEARSGSNDILGFGLGAAAAFALIAIVVWFTRRRWVLWLVGLFDAAVLVAYFALAGVREPPFEPWGLLIKVCQAVLLVAVALLSLRGHAPATSMPAAAPGIGGRS
jgi:hypothetical protein